MKASKKKKLEAKGWRVGDTTDFLELSNAEETFLEMKLALSRAFAARREKLHMTQVAVATLIGSSQSRVAKMEAGDPSVTIDLLLRGLLVLGVSPRKLGGVLSASAKRV